MLKAIIFDFDGTIVDTESAEYLSWKEVYEEHGCDLPIELWAQNVGTIGGPFDPYLHLEERMGCLSDREKIDIQRKSRHKELLKKETILPGVVTLIQQAHAKGLRIGLASSSSRAWVEGNLDRWGLLPFFDCIRTSDDVSHVKPDPELYLSAIEGLSVTSDEAIAFEDSVYGATAAKRAGIHCIVIPNQVTKHMDFRFADRCLQSMEDFNLDDFSNR